MNLASIITTRLLQKTLIMMHKICDILLLSSTASAEVIRQNGQFFAMTFKIAIDCENRNSAIDGHTSTEVYVNLEILEVSTCFKLFFLLCWFYLRVAPKQCISCTISDVNCSILKPISSYHYEKIIWRNRRHYWTRMVAKITFVKTCSQLGC